MNPLDPELLEALMVARMNNPGMFQSFWELDEQGVEEESEEEIQSIELRIQKRRFYGLQKITTWTSPRVYLMKTLHW